jgi:hypothetical protein
MDQEPATPKTQIRVSGFGVRQTKRQQQELKRMRGEDPYYHECLRKDRERQDMSKNDPQRLAQISELKNKQAMLFEDKSYWAIEAWLDLWNNEELF